MHLVKLRTNLQRWLVGAAFWLAKTVTPKFSRRATLCTYPDFDDTTRAFVEALRGSSSELVLLTERGAIYPAAWGDREHVRVLARKSLAGVWAYLTSRYVFFTHGCYSFPVLSSRQIIVNLWHGMPFKRNAYLDPANPRALVPRSHKTIAADESWRPIVAQAFGLEERDVILTPHPRLDRLASPSVHLRGVLGSPRLLVAWLPTYRAAPVRGAVDGDPRCDVVSDGVALDAVEQVLERHDAVCVVKPHPMAALTPDALSRYRRIRLVTNKDLAAAGASVYELLATSDVLVSDVSSVVVEWMALKRPTVLFMEDWAAYARTRGFIVDPRSVTGLPILETVEDLSRELDRLLTRAATSPLNRPARRSESFTSELVRKVAPELLAGRGERGT